MSKPERTLDEDIDTIIGADDSTSFIELLRLIDLDPITDLAGEVLDEVDLSEAYLETANLERVHLSGAKLNRANLKGASLRMANLRGADLEDATLSNADLSYADLTGAILRGTDFTGALLHETDVDQVIEVSDDAYSEPVDAEDWNRASIRHLASVLDRYAEESDVGTGELAGVQVLDLFEDINRRISRDALRSVTSQQYRRELLELGAREHRGIHRIVKHAESHKAKYSKFIGSKSIYPNVLVRQAGSKKVGHEIGYVFGDGSVPRSLVSIEAETERVSAVAWRMAKSDFFRYLNVARLSAKNSKGRNVEPAENLSAAVVRMMRPAAERLSRVTLSEAYTVRVIEEEDEQID